MRFRCNFIKLFALQNETNGRRPVSPDRTKERRRSTAQVLYTIDVKKCKIKNRFEFVFEIMSCVPQLVSPTINLVNEFTVLE